MKNAKFLVFISALLAVIFILFVIINGNFNSKEEKELALDDILTEVNLASNSSFSEVSESQITMYLPLGFSNYDNLLFAINDYDENEFFLIGKNLNHEQQAQIESLYSSAQEEENFIIYLDEKYIYVIKSEQYLYMIDGIIKSFINNYENKD